MSTRGRIVVLHFAAQMPFAGVGWQAVHYLVGLQRLGWDVWYVEDHGANPYDPRIGSVSMDCDYNLGYLRRIMQRFGLGERWAYWDAINNVYHGLSREQLHALFAEADALINLCGATRLRDEHLRCPARILVDTDPVYEQIKYAQGDPAARAYVGAHTHCFTYGENLGAADCPVPLGGVDWRPTRPPVDPALWPAPGGEPACFTTIATWENKGKNITYGDQTYLWSKHVNFLRFLDLPRRRPQICFKMAMLPPDQSVRQTVEDAGWRLIDPLPVSADLDSYRDFVSGSRGEFTVAKDIYVRPLSGWFSDRSVCYLAAGRPVVTMRTGFGKFIPVGRGLFDFATAEEALAAIDTIGDDYDRHSRAARALAIEYFGFDRVLPPLLAQAGL